MGATMDISHALGGDWAGRLATAIVVALGGAITSFLSHRKGRKEVQSDLQGEAQKAAKIAVSSLTSVVETLRQEVVNVRTEQLNERLECNVKLAAMKAQIDVMMAGPIAGYRTAP